MVLIPKFPFRNTRSVEPAASDGSPTPPPEYEDEGQGLVLRPKITKTDDDLRLELHPLLGGVLVSIHPPKAPGRNVKHMPCDIILVIDVSGSMDDEAPVPTTDPLEKKNRRNGLSILDLTKHAARTIIASLNENDRLGVISFSDNAEIVQQLVPMTPENKMDAWDRINKLKAGGWTNLWHGIREAITLIDGTQRPGSASAIMVLTDGQPNMMCPQQGYVSKLRTYECQASIHTFGFGYGIRSGLLKSIAEVGSGNYAFIPDAGMIGTVFVHAVANIQSTFARSAKLEIQAPQGPTLAEATGKYVRKVKLDLSDGPQTSLKIALGTLQYGQSRDILIKYGTFTPNKEKPQRVLAELSFDQLLDETGISTTSAETSVLDTPSVPQELVAYHCSRTMLCSFVSALYHLSQKEEYEPMTINSLSKNRAELETLLKKIPAAQFSDTLNQSLIEDISGQIRLALADEHFSRWGKHFLPSIHSAHMSQSCNSFKDPGPLEYGKDSSLFIKCRDELDHLFDTLPAPKPSIVFPMTRPWHRTVNGSTSTSNTYALKDQAEWYEPVSMKAYRNKDSVCFSASSKIRLAAGEKIKVRNLRPGMEVWTPKGGKEVKAIVSQAVTGTILCRLDDELLITPWHPICVNDEEKGNQWSFPADVAPAATSAVRYTGTIYSLLLERDEDNSAHAVQAGRGWVAVTLGHGVVEESTQVVVTDRRAHQFFGEYDKVLKGLKGLKTRNGAYVCKGVTREGETGLICGFA